jgi:hypothetical protein
MTLRKNQVREGEKRMGERAKRIDAKHRYPLRIEQDLFNEILAIQVNNNVSINCLLCEMIEFAYQNQAFQDMINAKYPKRRHGHFIYVSDWRK